MARSIDCGKFLCVLLPLAVLGGCDLLDVMQRMYTVEEITHESARGVKLQLVNTMDKAIWYNLCTATLQEKADGGWKKVAEGWLPKNSACTLEMHSLPPEGSDTFRGPLRESLPAGTYRFQDQIDVGSGESRSTKTVHTNSFELD